MDKTEFLNISQKMLEDLVDKIEEWDMTGDLEVDYINGILNIDLPNNRQYVINKHAELKEIWMSSPISGASHFKRSKSGDWLDSKGNEFYQTLRNEILEITS